MFRSRFSKFVGTVLCSLGLVIAGAFQVLPSMAAEDDFFSVTVRVVDKDTGMLINGKLHYLSSSPDKNIIFDNGGTISISKDDVLVGDDGEDYGTDSRVIFASGTEGNAKYQEPLRDDGQSNCLFHFADAGKTVTCTAEKEPYSTTLEVVDEDGNPVTLEPDDFFPSNFFYGDTLYYNHIYQYFTITKSGYLKKEVGPTDFVNGGTTTVVLKKAPTKEVIFKFVDALYYSEELEGATGRVRSDRDNNGEYSVTSGVPVTLPDYSSEGFGDSGYWVHLDSSSKLYFGDEYVASLSDENTISIPTVHVRVVDEDGYFVSGAVVSIVDTTLNVGDDGTLYPTNDEKRSKDFSSSADEDIVYVPLMTSPYCLLEESCLRSKIAVSVVAPEGYEHVNSDPVEFLHADNDLDDYVALGMTPDGRVDYSYLDFEDWQYMLGEYVIITLKNNSTGDPTPPGGNSNTPSEEPTISCDEPEGLCEAPYDPDEKPTTDPTAEPTGDPTDNPTGDPTTPGEDQTTSDDNGTTGADAEGNDDSSGGAGAGSVATGNSLSVTGAPVGIAVLSALILVGAGLLLRRKLYQ